MNGLRTIYDIAPEQLEDPKTTVADQIGRVLDWLDLLGVLVSKQIVDEELAVKGFAGNASVRCWYKLAKYIRQKQQSRGYYSENYEDFVHRCLKTFRHADIRIYLESDDRDLVKLIKEEFPEELRPRGL